MAGYGNLLAQAAAAAPGGAGTPLAGPGPAPAMPAMPGLPPPPTGVGKVDTGSKTPKDAASDAINALRELKGHFPAMAVQLDATIEAIKSTARPGGAASAPGANDGITPTSTAGSGAFGAPPGDSPGLE